MTERRAVVDACEVPAMIAELTAAMCLAPFADQPSEETRRGGRRLANAVRRMKDDLDAFLTEDVRNDLAELLEHIDRNRNRYRDAVLLWIDLLEEIAHLMEQQFGDKTGPMKKRQVRAAVYYLMKGFVGDQPLPHVPQFLRPVVLEIAVRWTIEFLVALDNAQSHRPGLWDQAGVTGAPKQKVSKTRIKTLQWWERSLEVVATWILGWFLKPPPLDGKLRVDVDRILAEWQKRHQEDGSTPAERSVGMVFRMSMWVGEHGDEVRAFVDLLTVAVLEAAKLTHLSRNERIAVIKEAIVMIVSEDLGFSGPLWGEVVRVIVDILADAIEEQFGKRGFLAA